jgi:hypothetical protein
MSLIALLSALRLAALSANNNLSDNAHADDLKQHQQSYLLLLVVFVTSHRPRCAFSKETLGGGTLKIGRRRRCRGASHIL